MIKKCKDNLEKRCKFCKNKDYILSEINQYDKEAKCKNYDEKIEDAQFICCNNYEPMSAKEVVEKLRCGHCEYDLEGYKHILDAFINQCEYLNNEILVVIKWKHRLDILILNDYNDLGQNIVFSLIKSGYEFDYDYDIAIYSEDRKSNTIHYMPTLVNSIKRDIELKEELNDTPWDEELIDTVAEKIIEKIDELKGE